MIPAILFPLRKLASAAAVLLGSCAGSHAALVDAGNGLVNDTDINVTWVRDANLFRTLAAQSGDSAGFVSAVIASVPGGIIADSGNFYDTPPFSGYHRLTAEDFSPDSGRMSWFGAQAWVVYLNGIGYGGYTGWRLPATAGDLGTGADSELGHLFYREFGGTTYESIVTTHADAVNFGLFANVQDTVYWSGAEYLRGPYMAWAYSNGSGLQDYTDKNSSLFGWAVRSGQAVPAPAAMWLLGSALLGLAGLRRIGAGRG
jgi:hypothetical protein